MDTIASVLQKLYETETALAQKWKTVTAISRKKR